jgi:lysophospholipase L1-like esterase
MEGVNDVNNGLLTPEQIVDSLRRNIRRALQRGVKAVFVSTLLPQVPGRPKAFQPDGIDPVNEEIRFGVPAEGGILVDAHAVFNPQKELLIGVDGLHPNAEGYALLAQTFLEALQTHFEEPVAASPSGPPPGSSPASQRFGSPRRFR